MFADLSFHCARGRHTLSDASEGHAPGPPPLSWASGLFSVKFDYLSYRNFNITRTEESRYFKELSVKWRK